MSGEEMEITTDFGQPSFAEDIDIDLDFGSAPQGQDLDLADFDQAEDIHDFNSDVRDEMMVEGDDASFGMLDADDMNDQEEPITNDIDIDIGDNDEDAWKPTTGVTTESTAPGVSDDTGNVGTEEGGLQSDNWLEPSTQDVVINDDSLGDQPGMSIFAQRDAEVRLESTEQPERPQGSETVHLEVNEGAQSIADQQSVAPQNSNDDVQTHGRVQAPDSSSPESGDITHDKSLTAIDNISGNLDQPGAEGSGRAQEQEQPQQNELGRVQDHEVVTNLPDGGDQVGNEAPHRERSGPVPDTAEGKVNVGSFVEQHPDSHGSSDDVARDVSILQPNNNGELDDAGLSGKGQNAPPTAGSDGQSTTSEPASQEHSASITNSLDIFITYGSTDYRLFAKSEDDDPNHYFLNDTEALGLSLAGFLSSLREVIAEEVSPLDELVMHVDGLGLEFSESSTSGFLEQYTFGDILRLYDNLVRNDEARTPPGFFTYLMVRPNCSLRFKALLDSASSGRGLSEIAVYRESPNFDNAQQISSESPGPSALLDEEQDDLETYLDDDAGSETNLENAEYEGNDNEASTANANSDVANDATDQHSPGSDEHFEEDADHPNYIDLSISTALEVSNDTAADELDLGEMGESIPGQDEKLENPDALAYDTGSYHDAQGEVNDDGEGHAHQRTPSLDDGIEPPPSDHTSATATLNGDGKDVIDYSEDDDDGVEKSVGLTAEQTATSKEDQPATLKVPVEDEITWESENEDASPEILTTASQSAVQVSPATGKRARSEMNDHRDVRDANGKILCARNLDSDLC
jgi:hypothetical protein